MRYLVVLLVACGAAQHARPPSPGTITGIASDRSSGDPIAKAELRLRADGEIGTPRLVVSDQNGRFDFTPVEPGRYNLSGTFAGQQVMVDTIIVRAGEKSVVDVVFTLGLADDEPPPSTDPSAIRKQHPTGLDAMHARIEGTVSDLGTGRRIAGAAVSAIRPEETKIEVTDDEGRFRFDALPPATYTISAYYSIAGRGQMEIRRSDIVVAAGEGAFVPLFIELTKQ